ncbi:N-acetylglucosaminylphosphatidylinositol deacetylase [Pancytospora epiphaga]|nr:N-acetylglucosaminylphosphatidylinositol deacetylase [Pancytospora epiphaga]
MLRTRNIFIYTLFVLFVLRNIPRIRVSGDDDLGNILLITAHPDDESMFFSPLLYHCNPTILCLSDGNYEGLGKIRKAELENLCNMLGIQCNILNYKDNTPWQIDHVVLDVLQFISNYRFDTIVTFDSHGVSGHHNHSSCYKAVSFIENILPRNFFKYRYLKSTSFIQKFIFDINRKMYITPVYSTFGFRNMLFHRSQMVHFRYLYCIFSTYMHYNDYYTSASEDPLYKNLKSIL